MNSKTILLVEDNPSDRDLTKRALVKGHISNELVIAEDGQEALDYLRGEGAYAGRNIAETPAVVLLDLNLPKVSGLEVLRLIRADPRLRRVPVVILTSSREEEDVGAGYDLHVNSYVRKPVDFKEFQIAIENLGLYWLILNEPNPPVR
jgi:two-component system response regulator